jgi:3-phosphoshikimate 1-carboxyvinyltransferase
VPGANSDAHRALILAALAVGRSTLRGLPDDADTHRVAAALTAFGAGIERHAGGLWTVDGVGIGGLAEPQSVLDLGGSATATGLLIALAATHPMTAFFTGDAALTGRSIAELLAPLSLMGAEFVGRAGSYLPIAVTGAALAAPIDHATSPEWASALLFAGLNIPGRTRVSVPCRTPDQGEWLLRRFGASVVDAPLADGGRRIEIVGQPELAPIDLDLPGAPGLAAFSVLAALLTQGSDLTLRRVGLGSERAGLFEILGEMGASIEIVGAESSLRVRESRLRSVTVPADRAGLVSDDYLILAVAAACAHGRTMLCRPGSIEALATGLARCGVAVQIDAGDLVIEGAGGPPPGGARIDTGVDPSLALAFLVLGLAARVAVTIEDGHAIRTEFPGFIPFMCGLGADIVSEEP